MRVNAASLVAAIPMAAFVKADAFVAPSSTPLAPLAANRRDVGGSSLARVPLAAAGGSCDRRHGRTAAAAAAPWSATALGMSGGGGGGGEAVATEGTATIPDEIFNLVKSIIGAGVLSLPAGAFRRWLSSVAPLLMRALMYNLSPPSPLSFRSFFFDFVVRYCRIRKCAERPHPGHDHHHLHRGHLRLHLPAHRARLQDDRRDVLRRLLG